MKIIFNKWFITTFVVALLLTSPIWLLISVLFEPTNENWAHLVNTVLSEYVLNSLLLMLGVSVGTLFFGVSSAWLVTQYRFFGRDVLQWALLLPFAMPAYIIAYTYTGLLDFGGPVQGYLRTIISPETLNTFFPEIRTLGGAITMMSLVLYPYVYLLARVSFAGKSQSITEVSKTLGAGPVKRFFKIALPIARPAIIVGLTLALMETLADYGTVQYFGVPTFTTGIFRTWAGFDDTTTAAQLSLLLLVFVTTLILLEIWSRKQAKYFEYSQSSKPSPRSVLTGSKSFWAFFVCLVPVVFGFIVPAGQLLYWSVITADTGFNAEFFTLMWNSFYLAFLVASATVVIALLLVYSKRIQKNKVITSLVKVTTLGYAIPGIVIAIAVLILFTSVDHYIDGLMQYLFNTSTGLLLSGTLSMLVFAYIIRFLSISVQSLDSGLNKIKPSMDDTALTLGASRWKLLFKVHLPLLHTSLITAFILVFVDVLKELPTTLILRPFNFNTLSVRAFEMASDERLVDAGLPALLIVIIGIIPVIILTKITGKQS